MNKITLLNWQIQALTNWIENKGQGVIQAPTGSGKTYTVLKLMQNDKFFPFIVVVPTAELMKQWRDRIMKYYPERGIMLIGDGNKVRNFDVDIKIGIVNSLRKARLNVKSLILDEIHHYTRLAEVNHLIWNNIKARYVLGLSASPIPERLGSEDTGWNVPMIYEYSLQQAYEDKVLLKPEIESIEVNLKENEQEEYDILTEKIKAKSGSFGNFSNAPVWFKQWIFERSNILFGSKRKLSELRSILTGNEFKKAIIFTERIASADEIAKEVNSIGIECLSLHSSLKKKERNQLVNRFINTSFPVVLTTAHLFEEGMDVPEVDLLVLYSFNSTKRESLQRIGRSLHNHTSTPKVFILYYDNTKEVYAMKKIRRLFE